MSEFELTQSSLKDFMNLPRQDWRDKWIYKIRKYDPNTSFIFGSILDGLLFEPEVLKKRFITYRGKDKVSEGLQGVIGLVAKNYTKSANMDDLIIDACKELDFGKSWKRDTILKRFEGISDYISFCMNNKHRTVVFPEVVRNIQSIVNYLLNHEPNSIRKYILANPSEDYFNKFQVTLRGAINKLPCKVIIDILHFDEINSTVRVIDFKTAYDTTNFVHESITKYGYDTQVSFYNTILEQNPSLYEGYTLLPPLNVVVAKRNLDILVYEYEDKRLAYSKSQWIKVVKEIASYLDELNYAKK